jgi:hypothetical protein
MNPTAPFVIVFALPIMAACHRAERAASNGGTDSADVPIACKLDALTPPERARQAELRRAVVDAVVGIDEMPDGFRLRFADAASLPQLAEWIPLERRCCPFLSFDVAWPTGAAGPALHLSGRPGVKEFLAAEMNARP